MRAYQIRQYGPPLSHSVQELPAPAAGPGHVLIKVKAIGLNYPDALMVQGKYQKRPEPPFVPGRDCAGIVVGAGLDVTDFAPGDRVVAQVFSGAFAEIVAAPRERVFRLPDAVSLRDAAGAMTVFNTAYVAVSLRARVQSGERVVVTGAAGGVGTAALQLAKALGARTLGLVSSEDKAALIRSCGADQALLFTSEGEDATKDFFKTQVRQAWGDDRGADVVIDTVGGDVFTGALRCLGFGGRLVIVGFASGDIPSAKANYLLYNNLSVVGAPLDIHFAEALDQLRAGTEWWLDLMARGACRASITQVVGFEGLMGGLKDMLDRRIKGKIVVAMDA